MSISLPDELETRLDERIGMGIVGDLPRYIEFQLARSHFITFFQLLREKNFIRPLDAAEVDKLRQNVQSVTCSSCGAPVISAPAPPARTAARPSRCSMPGRWTGLSSS